jgi:hypothetical protein
VTEDIKKPESAELEAAPDNGEETAIETEAPLPPEETVEALPEKDEDISAAVPEETPKAEFKPFYKKEARQRTSLNFGLFIVFIILGLGLIVAAVSTFVFDAPFKLETTTIAVICIALIGLLWKKLSIQVKTGLAAFALGLQAAMAYTVYAAVLSWPPVVPDWVFLPALLCVVTAAALLAVWLLWPKIHWLPLVLSLVILYGAIAAILPLVQGQGTTMTMFAGPDFMSQWPVFLRSGYFLAQVVLPLGIVLFLILQARTLFRPQYASHWGFLYWALCLAVVWTVALAALERADQPVFPHVTQLAARIHTPEISTQPEATASVTTTSAPTEATESEPSSEQIEPAPTQPSPEVAASPPTEATAPEVVEETPSPTETPEGSVPEFPAPAPGEAVTEPEPSQETIELKKRVRMLEEELGEMDRRLEAQERLIRALLDVFGDKDLRLGPEPEPLTPGEEFKLPIPEAPIFPHDWQDYT